MKIRGMILWAALAALAAAAPARAAYVYQFTDASGNAISSASQTPNGSLTLQVYLLETGGTTTLRDNKLFSAGVRVTYDNPPGSGTPSGVTAVTSVQPNPQFDFVGTRSIGPAFTDLNEGVIQNPQVSPDANNRILIGNFTFSGINPGSVQVTAIDIPGTNNTLLGNATVIDSQIAAGSITITVVPEPGSLLLTGLAAVGFGCWRRRRSAGR